MRVTVDPGFIAWQRSLCSTLKIGGMWGIPKTGAILQKTDDKTLRFNTFGPGEMNEGSVYLSAMVVVYIKAAGFHILLPEVVRCVVDEKLLKKVTGLLAEYSLASVLDAIVKSKEQQNQHKLDECKPVISQLCDLPEKQLETAGKLEKLYSILAEAKTAGAGL